MVLDSSKCTCSHQKWYRFQSLKLRFRVDGENDSKTQRVDGEFFENGEKVSVFKQKWLRVDWAKVD